MPGQRRTPGTGYRTALRAARRGVGVGRLSPLAIAVGGAAGALARAGIAAAFPAAAGEWPWGTFIANQLGTLLLAWVATELAEAVAPARLWRPLLGTGFCGALTTFSAFQVETIQIAAHGRPALAAAYALVSLTAGIACAVLGTIYSRRARYG